jgi:hypothetical protein
MPTLATEVVHSPKRSQMARAPAQLCNAEFRASGGLWRRKGIPPRETGFAGYCLMLRAGGNDSLPLSAHGALVATKERPGDSGRGPSQRSRHQ